MKFTGLALCEYYTLSTAFFDTAAGPGDKSRRGLGPKAHASFISALYNINVKKLRAFILLLAAFAFTGEVKALDISFDGGSGTISGAVAELRSSGAALPAVSAPSAPAAPAAFRVYDFKELYKSLGYPSPDYFGSSEAEISDLESYTSKEDTFYQEINGYLRYYPGPYDWSGTGPDLAKTIVANIDSIFTRVPALPRDLVLFRGLGLGYHGNKPYAAGEEFADKAYISTSASFKVAKYFAVDMNESKGRKAVFAIYFSRPGEKGILFDQGEDEVILKHGRKFRVMAARGMKGYDLYLVQACGETCETTLSAPAARFWGGFGAQD